MKKCNLWFSGLWFTVCHSVSVASRKYFISKIFPSAKLALVAIALTVAACSGGGGGGDGSGSNSSTSGFVVSGTVSAPGGAVAFLPRKNLLEQFADAFIASAYAAISGIAPVPDGTTVELVRINNAGVVISVLATTTTSGGSYSFNLTVLGLSTASDLVVQVTSPSTGAKMRAFVVSESVNLDPVSETSTRIVLDTIAATPGLVLANFTVQELADITAAVNLLVAVEGLSGGVDIVTTVAAFKSAVSADTGIMTFVTAASAPGQSLEGPGDTGNYFPLSQGDTWFFSGTISEDGLPSTDFNNTVRFTGTRTVNGVSVAVLNASNHENAGATELYLTKGSSGVTNYGNSDAQDFLASQLIPYQEIKFPPKIGSSFEQINKSGLNWPDSDYDGLSESAAAVSTVSTVGFENVVVTAGSFANCLKVVSVLTITVTFSSDGSQVTVTETDTNWYAPGVGPVKRTSTVEIVGAGVFLTESEQLTGYIVSGQADGISIQVSPTTASTYIGGTPTFTATAFDPFNNPMSGLTFSWASSNPTVATINAVSGRATGIAKGTTQITASYMGIISSPVILNVADQRHISLATNDLIYDSYRNRIYASVPGSAGAIGNTITIIDPDTGAIGPSVFIGSEPGRLAISDNGQYLYVALDGSAAVRRLILSTMTPDIQFSLGSDPSYGLFYASDIEVLPGSPGSIAVARGYVGRGNEGHAGVAIFDNGVARPATTPQFPGTGVITGDIEFSASAGRLYGYNNQTSGGEFYRITVNSSGVSILDETAGLIYSNSIKFDDGRIYSSSGRVFDPEARTLVGTYPLAPFSISMAVQPDSSNNLVFALEYESSAWRIETFDLKTFIRLDTDMVLGASPDPGLSHNLIRWGRNGLAFRSNGNKIILMRSALIP